MGRGAEVTFSVVLPRLGIASPVWPFHLAIFKKLVKSSFRQLFGSWFPI